MRKIEVVRVATVIALSICYPLLADDTAKDATEFTIRENQKVLGELPFGDRTDFENAKRGFIAPLKNDGIVKNTKGRLVFDAVSYQFPLDKAAPPTVNPSLWRKAQINGISGLFKVADGLYQVRGQDISNLTIVEGVDGIVVIDPLISVETAKNALETYFEHRPKKEIKAVIYTHSHVDHYAGVKGVVTAEEVASGKVKIIAPAGFMDEAISENVLAGNAMIRRSGYSYAMEIPTGERGNLGTGLGPSPSVGSTTLIAPTDTITHDWQAMTIAGIEFEFMLAPGSEAPAEMHFYIPSMKALCTAENCVHTLHNFYTLRGAKTRDVSKWAGYLNQTLDRWGEEAEILYAPHNTPIWGNANLTKHIEDYRDALRYIHDQTLNLLNQGYKINDVGNMIELPASLAKNWATRGYYGSVSHNARAVYNFYLGYFDGNPANLNPYGPVEEGKRFVKTFGEAKIMQAAQEAFNQGDYRWTAELLKHVINADPHNRNARLLQADAFEQMGYQAESSTWRGFYLVGAKELRGNGEVTIPTESFASDTLMAMTPEMLLDFLSTRIDPKKADDKEISVFFVFPGKDDTLALTLKNSVLNYRIKRTGKPDAEITLDRESLCKILYGATELSALVKEGKAKIEGNADALEMILNTSTAPKPFFPVAAPMEQ